MQKLAQARGNTDEAHHGVESAMSDYTKTLEQKSCPLREKGSGSMDSDPLIRNHALYSPVVVKDLRKLFRDLEVQRARSLSKRDKGGSPGDVAKCDSEDHKERALDTPVEVGPVESSFDLNSDPVVDGFLEAINTMSINIIAVRIGDKCEHKCTEIKETVAKICGFIDKRIKKKQNQYHLVVFPESFFNCLKGNPRMPLEGEDVKDIIDGCETLLARDNVICSFCFMQKLNPKD